MTLPDDQTAADVLRTEGGGVVTLKHGPRAGDQIKMTELSVPCICGRVLYFSSADKCIAHGLPTCGVYDALPADQYLTLVRKHYQRLGIIAGDPSDP